MASRGLRQTAQSVTVANVTTITFSSPQTGTVWTGSLSIFNAAIGATWTITISGLFWGQGQGAGPFGPVQLSGGDQLVITSAGLASPGAYATLIGSVDPDDGSVPYVGPAQLPAPSASTSPSVVFTNNNHPNITYVTLPPYPAIYHSMTVYPILQLGNSITVATQVYDGAVPFDPTQYVPADEWIVTPLATPLNTFGTPFTIPLNPEGDSMSSVKVGFLSTGATDEWMGILNTDYRSASFPFPYYTGFQVPPGPTLSVVNAATGTILAAPASGAWYLFAYDIINAGAATYGSVQSPPGTIIGYFGPVGTGAFGVGTDHLQLHGLRTTGAVALNFLAGSGAGAGVLTYAPGP